MESLAKAIGTAAVNSTQRVVEKMADELVGEAGAALKAAAIPFIQYTAKEVKDAVVAIQHSVSQEIQRLHTILLTPKALPTVQDLSHVHGALEAYNSITRVLSESVLDKFDV